MLRPVDANLVTLIQSAIVERRVVEFIYDSLPRIAEPHILGECRGSLRLLVYQFGGKSASGGLPQWRMFYVDRISQMTRRDLSFAARPEAPNQFHFDAIYARSGAQ